MDDLFALVDADRLARLAVEGRTDEPVYLWPEATVAYILDLEEQLQDWEVFER